MIKFTKDKNPRAHSNYFAAHDALRRKFIFFGPYPHMGRGRDTATRGRPKLYGDNQRLR